MTEYNGLGLHLGSLSRLSKAKSFSISPENFTGEKGEGGKAEGEARRGLPGWGCRGEAGECLPCRGRAGHGGNATGDGGRAEDEAAGDGDRGHARGCGRA